MRRLKDRRSFDRLENQPRLRRQMVTRWLYLAGLCALALWLGNLFFGSLFYFRSEGIVLGESSVVAAEFPVTVRNLPVREGEHVKAGEVTALVSSQSVVENIAKLAGDLATREARISELRVRARTIDAIVGLAQSRQSVASSTRKEFEKLVGQGYLPLDKRSAAIESEFRSRQDLESLKAEKEVVEAELATLERSFAQADAALNDLRALYDSGQMRAPIDGIVSRLAADRGAVIRAGDPLLEIYGDDRFVLAYLPTGALYKVEPGDKVEIEAGLRAYRGTVARVEPFAAALPREFQRAFTPVDRQQVIRVEFVPGEPVPPLFTKVKLRSLSILPPEVRHAAAALPAGTPVVLLALAALAGIALALWRHGARPTGPGLAG